MPVDPYYHTREWKQLRLAALKRDNYRCTVRGCQDKATHVDHIKARRSGGADALYNLRSLCQTHDSQVHHKPDGTRARDGKFKLLGCDVDGWPHARR